ncbi:hypothetical protein [Acanthopleuribacter pedis]|uniref:Uncharacterized protein n=1 Tax=Acanthopleuribacter pedis TaxID=442870 RepID=A0A8J7QV58_9BACT|nr:hypothetical protein [Acanthopleuribacter pedis]MBO1323438.1 hypothetical protein [Acanthopleuribacter pedis]
MVGISLGFFLLISNFEKDLKLTLDDLNPLMFFSATGHEDTSLISYVELSSRPVNRLFLYDFDKGNGQLIEDGRLASFPTSNVTVIDKGFVVFEVAHFRPPRLALLDFAGGFVDLLRIHDFEGWKNEYSVTRAFSMGSGRLLLTVQILSVERPDQTRFQPAILDLDKKSISLLDITIEDAKMTFWVPSHQEDKLIQIDPLRGGIVLTSLAGDPYQTLMKGGPLFKKPGLLPALKRISDNQGPATLRYQTTLQFVVPMGDKISACVNHFDVDGKVTKKQGVIIDQNGIEVTETLMIWAYRNLQIHYDLTDKRFFLNQSQGRP